MDNWDDFISGLNEDPAPIPVRKTSNQKRYPCGQCAGTGRWAGGVNRHGNSNCLACKGKGYFVTDPRKLQENRAEAAAKKIDAYKAFHDANADVILEINNAADWSDFARSLSNQLAERKPWSENQLAAAQRMAAKLVAKREARAAERKSQQVSVNLQPIRVMFETARGNGHKRPTYRAEGLVINRAPDYGSNPGALYVKDEAGEYMGKILGTTFTPSRNGASVGAVLQRIAENPLEAAVRYGRRTGRCACCGRELTNALSVELGIGPICRDKWGL